MEKLYKVIDHFYKPIHAEGITPKERFDRLRRFEAFLDEAKSTFPDLDLANQYRLAAFDYSWFREKPEPAKEIFVDCVQATQRCISKSIGYKPETPTVKTA